jgi:hypothetical protein
MPKGLSIGQPYTLASIVSSDKATGGVFTGNLRTVAITATARAIQASDCISVILNATALTTDASPKLQVFLQHSWDGGTTWVSFLAFAAVTGSTDAQTITFRSTGLGHAEAATRTSVTTGTNTTIVQNCVVGPDQRIGWLLQGTGITTATFTLGVIAQPFGTAGV